MARMAYEFMVSAPSRQKSGDKHDTQLAIALTCHYHAATRLNDLRDRRCRAPRQRELACPAIIFGFGRMKRNVLDR